MILQSNDLLGVWGLMTSWKIEDDPSMYRNNKFARRKADDIRTVQGNNLYYSPVKLCGSYQSKQGYGESRFLVLIFIYSDSPRIPPKRNAGKLLVSWTRIKWQMKNYDLNSQHPQQFEVKIVKHILHFSSIIIIRFYLFFIWKEKYFFKNIFIKYLFKKYLERNRFVFVLILSQGQQYNKERG